MAQRKSLEDLEKHMEALGLSGCFRAAGAFARNAIHLRPQFRAEGKVPAGASKLGGLPDLPAELAWPRSGVGGFPLSFVCQINFAEVHPYDAESRLPERGMLYLFYDCSEDGMPWGFDPADRDGRMLYFYDGSGPLERRPAPEGLEKNGSIFGEARFRFDQEFELPNPESDLLDMSLFPEEEMDRYWEYIDSRDAQAGSKLLGHSDNIQGGMELECESVTAGLFMGGGSRSYQTARAWRLDRNAGRWTLLLQIDSEEDLGMLWGDCGRLYLWITTEDLAARELNHAWLILQCT